MTVIMTRVWYSAAK